MQPRLEFDLDRTDWPGQSPARGPSAYIRVHPCTSVYIRVHPCTSVGRCRTVDHVASIGTMPNPPPPPLLKRVSPGTWTVLAWFATTLYRFRTSGTTVLPDFPAPDDRTPWLW